MRGLVSLAVSAPYGGDAQGDVDAPSDSHLRITVVTTTPQGTIAALKAAATLAKDLCGQIDVQVHEPVPIHFSLQRPHVSVDFLEERLLRMIREAAVPTEAIAIHVWLCRSRKLSLEDSLAPRSLVVMGVRLRWWNWHARSLARWLRARGHHVVLVPAGSKRPDPKVDRGRQATYLRSLGYPGVSGLGR